MRWLPRMHQPSVKSVAWRRELLHTLAAEMIMNGHRGLLVVLSLAALAGCGGGGDSGSSGGGGGGGGGEVASLNAYRDASDGTDLQTVASNSVLATAATRHAGWQAIDDQTQPGANLDHGEPRNNALFTNDDMGNRIRSANGGSDISGANRYFEDIASTAGTTAITQLWNSVYHRLPMMRHRANSVGYGDMAMARTQFPAAGVPATDEWGNSPAGNGYATLNWAAYATPTITLSYWPGNGTTSVPKTFASNTESPDPVAGRNEVGCPIHLIFPETNGFFTSINATLVTGGTNIPLMALVGNAGSSGNAGDVSSLTIDTAYLDPGEVFLIPIPTPTNTGLAANTSYTYSVSVILDGTPYNVPNITFTTGP